MAYIQNPRGEGSLASPKKFKNQDFVRLRDHCLNHGLLFEDYTFPADHSSIGPGLLSDAQLLQIQWFRPTVSSSQVCNGLWAWLIIGRG
uniref:Uncharacterized protein n=1 Tax=Varanus komodoensis TaxID=61221 RepID=A0A8D2LX19_VARKO